MKNMSGFMLRISMALFCCLLAALCPLRAAEQRVTEDEQEVRYRLAETFDKYTFEPGSATSRDGDGDLWPDFWEKVVDDTNKEYLVRDVKIVEDKQRLGALAGESGYVLQVPFDGTGVALQTRVPRKINPEMAYEISAWGRSLRLEHSIAGITVLWVNINNNDGARTILSRNYITIPPGQLDWTEAPLTVRVNNVPANATHVIMRISIYDNPNIPGADRHGMAWFDDITISARPKIYMTPTFKDYVPDDLAEPPVMDFNILYKGLVNNVPEDIAKQNGGLSKSYFRVIEISDIFGRPPQTKDGRPLRLLFPKRKSIYPGTLSSFPEKLKINFKRLGVYYLTVRLYGHGGQLLAERTQVLGLWLPPQKRNMGVSRSAF